MTSSDQTKPKRRRWLPRLILALLVLFGLYSAGWYWLAARVRSDATNTVAALAAKGINADCANLTVSGYPMRFVVTCDGLAYQDDARNVAAAAGGMIATASLAQPLTPNVNLDGPLRTSVPDMPPLWIDWDQLDISGHLWWPLPSRISVTAEGFNGQTDPTDETDPVQLFSVGQLTAAASPNGQDLVLTHDFTDLEIDAHTIGGRVLPPFSGKGDATVKNGIPLLGAPPKSLRGQSAEIRNLELSSGEARIVLAGPIAVDADGLIDATLNIKLQNPKAVAAILATAIPEQANQIRQGFAALSMLGNEPTMPLKVVKGRASLGFIPLGMIKPVE